MIDVSRFSAKEFTSNVFLITHNGFPQEAYLIDTGCVHNLLQIMAASQPKKLIQGIFLTHAHYDHIQDLSELLKFAPKAMVYCSEYTLDSLRSSKLNLSHYHDKPFEYHGDNIHVLTEGDKVPLFSDEFTLTVLETPGHNAGCLSFSVGNYLFTGDSLIPGFPVVTCLRTGSKKTSNESIKKLTKVVVEGSVVCPGHGKMKFSRHIDWHIF